ncbi:hypothetical protein HIV01_008445 [Lysobacter arenosi]|uniref:Uncharacterized protein n=1 Tax=Lysobacter arenosi TaxID=2795387 RepID=A0ABX7RHN3_9GAMM|nr:hypothetical protein [Lysobacter arenosi]QSX76484.1 hypothetical protein HIV01_008445 [Lysobacter arenosi]
MNVPAASVMALSSLVSIVAPVDAIASDGTIYIKGAIVQPTMDPTRSTTRKAEGDEPRYSMRDRPLPLKLELELLDYYAQYMHEFGVAQAQLTLRTSVYE